MCLSQALNLITSALSCTVFLLIDLLDLILCILYRFLDGLFQGQSSLCYCQHRGNEELSETLFRRKNVFREMGFVGNYFSEKDGGNIMGGSASVWSDCGCESCLLWINNNGDYKLHVCVLEPTQESIKDNNGRSSTIENVIFLHGFLSSSSFWTETVFPNLSEPVKLNYRLLAFDLLGFGKSPKPRDCFYTLKDHLDMIEKSVLSSFDHLDSFHLVAHSMGCVIALALAAKFPNSIKSITLVAPPFFPSKEGSLKVLEKLAERRLWPLLTFGSAVMSWYEHIGRSVCFVICRNHRTWEKLLKLVTWRRDLHFMITDITRHTHRSAWHTMHNVICGGSQHMESFLRVLTESRVKIHVVQGDRDQVVPVECSENFKKLCPIAGVDLIKDADHISVVLGREREIVRYLESKWTSGAGS